MRCIDCDQKTTRVTNSGVTRQGVSFRLRKCPVCNACFRTEEVVMRRVRAKSCDNSPSLEEEQKALDKKIDGLWVQERVSYDRMLRPIPILDKDIAD